MALSPNVVWDGRLFSTSNQRVIAKLSCIPEVVATAGLLARGSEVVCSQQLVPIRMGGEGFPTVEQASHGPGRFCYVTCYSTVIISNVKLKRECVGSRLETIIYVL